jgi:hypothetical protein
MGPQQEKPRGETRYKSGNTASGGRQEFLVCFVLLFTVGFIETKDTT